MSRTCTCCAAVCMLQYQVLISPPRKRHRSCVPGQSRQPAAVKQPAAPATTAQQAQHAKMAGVMKGIGLAPKQQTTVRQTSGAPVRHAVKVTKTVIVHNNKSNSSGSTTRAGPSSPAAAHRVGPPPLQAGKQQQGQLLHSGQDRSKSGLQHSHLNSKPSPGSNTSDRTKVPPGLPGKLSQPAGRQAAAHSASHGAAATAGTASKPAPVSGLFKHFKT
jgi:hypothetical protein